MKSRPLHENDWWCLLSDNLEKSKISLADLANPIDFYTVEWNQHLAFLAVVSLHLDEIQYNIAFV